MSIFGKDHDARELAYDLACAAADTDFEPQEILDEWGNHDVYEWLENQGYEWINGEWQFVTEQMAADREKLAAWNRWASVKAA